MISKEQADELNRIAMGEKIMREYSRIDNRKSATSHVAEWWVSCPEMPSIRLMTQHEIECLLDKNAISVQRTLVKHINYPFWECISQTPCIPDSMLENIDWQKYLAP